MSCSSSRLGSLALCLIPLSPEHPLQLPVVRFPLGQSALVFLVQPALHRALLQHRFLMLPPSHLPFFPQALLASVARCLLMLKLAQARLIAPALSVFERPLLCLSLLAKLHFFSPKLLLLPPRSLFLSMALLL